MLSISQIYPNFASVWALSLQCTILAGAVLTFTKPNQPYLNKHPKTLWSTSNMKDTAQMFNVISNAVVYFTKERDEIQKLREEKAIQEKLRLQEEERM